MVEVNKQKKECFLAPSGPGLVIIYGSLKHYSVHTWHRPINHTRQLLNEMSSLIGEEAKEQLQRTDEGRGNGKDLSNETEERKKKTDFVTNWLKASRKSRNSICDAGVLGCYCLTSS